MKWLSAVGFVLVLSGCPVAKVSAPSSSSNTGATSSGTGSHSSTSSGTSGGTGTTGTPTTTTSTTTTTTSTNATSTSGTHGTNNSSTSTSTSTSSSSSGTTGTHSSTTSSSSTGTSSGGSTGTIVQPGNPGQGDVTFTIHADQNAHAISKLIYGWNGGDPNGAQKGITFSRSGGNRMTAYNWETNASNAGSDYLYENDTYLGGSTPLAVADTSLIQTALGGGASALVTIPIAGYVSADTNGPCDPHGGDINTRFFPTVAVKGSAFSTTPDLTDGKVYQDECVNYLKTQFPNAFATTPAQVLFSMDNEPDLWSSTHSEIHPAATQPDELVQKDVEFAKAVKSVAPNALVTGFVSYGFEGYLTLQGTYSGSGWYTEYWLDQMQQAETQAGFRVIDVLDLHWYPEATGNGTRITGNDTSSAVVQARIQAPRSLWDPNYNESSWIQQSLNGPIHLIPTLMSQIAQHYPGTKLGFTEYNYGAGGDISAGIAEADVLGIFGREGVFLASVWPLNSDESMNMAGISAYVNYDGNGGSFGDTSVEADTTDVTNSSVYASIDSGNPSRMVLVAINKASSTKTAAISLAAYGTYSSLSVYQLTAAGATLSSAAAVNATATNAFLYSMPAMSVSVLVPH